MDDQRAYEYIKTIIDRGTFTEASKKLYISQSSLSQYINRLEEELDSKIIIRNIKPCKLTEFGEILFEKLEKIYLIKKSIIEGAKEINDMEYGKVTIGSLNYHSVCILANVLPYFRKKYPNIEINILEGSLIELEKFAKEGKTDFSLLIKPIISKSLEYDYLFKEEILISINKDVLKNLNLSLDKNRNNEFLKVDLNDLSELDFIILSPEKRLRRTYEEASAIMKTPPTVLLETNDITNAIILSSLGMGLTFCTSVFARNYKNNLPLKFLSPKQKLAVRPIIAAYNKNYPLNRSAKKLLKLIKLYSRGFL